MVNWPKISTITGWNQIYQIKEMCPDDRRYFKITKKKHKKCSTPRDMSMNPQQEQSTLTIAIHLKRHQSLHPNNLFWILHNSATRKTRRKMISNPFTSIRDTLMKIQVPLSTLTLTPLSNQKNNRRLFLPSPNSKIKNHRSTSKTQYKSKRQTMI